MKRLVVLSILLLLLTGAVEKPGLGLRTVQSCDDDPKLTNPTQRIPCYHAAAVTSAYLGNLAEAKSTCNHIWLTFGTDPALQDTDIPRKAELVTNNCYSDVAKITKDIDTCDSIYPRDSGQAVDTELLGGTVSQEMCKDDVRRLNMVSPQNYYAPGNENICSIIYVLPLLLMGSLRIRVCP